MTKKTLLVVDGDPKSLYVMEVSLRKAGYSVITASDGKLALEKACSSSPDLIISEIEIPVMNGFELRENLKKDPNLADIPFVFLTKQTGIEAKVRGLKLGVHDYLTKPIYIREVITRVEILLQKKERESFQEREPKTYFSGTLHDMGVVDLIQTLEIGKKTGIAHFVSAHDPQKRGTVYVRDGKVIDAELGALRGEKAFYRLLLWNNGTFQFAFETNFEHPTVISLSTQALLMEGIRRVDEWTQALEQTPGLDSLLEVKAHRLAECLSEIPDEANKVLHAFDGTPRTLQDLVDKNSLDGLETLNIVSKLYCEGIITEVESPPIQSNTHKLSVVTPDTFSTQEQMSTPEKKGESKTEENNQNFGYKQPRVLLRKKEMDSEIVEDLLSLMRPRIRSRDQKQGRAKGNTKVWLFLLRLGICILFVGVGVGIGVCLFYQCGS